MKHFITFTPAGEPHVTYSVDPAYICALRDDPAREHNSYVYITTMNAGIALSREEFLRVKRQLTELNHPTLPIQSHEEQKAPATETQTPNQDDIPI